MEAQELREKLTEYIKVADERKLEAIYTLVEGEIESEYKWWKDEAFIKELDEDVRRLESGEEKGYTMEDVNVFLEKRKAERAAAHV